MSNALTSPWIPAVVLFGSASISRLLQRSWLAPSAFAPLIWSFYVAIPLTLAPEYSLSAFSVWNIVLFVLCIQIGATLTETGAQSEYGRRGISTIDCRRLLTIALMLAALGIAGELYLAYIGLQNNNLPYSMTAILALGHLLSVDRYSGIQEPLLVRMLVAWMFPSAILGGLVFAESKRKSERVLALSAMIPALLSGLFQSTKAPALIVVCCFLSTYISGKAKSSNGSYQFFNRKALTAFLALIIVATGMFVMFDSVRVHTYGRDLDITPDWIRIKGSSIGYLSAFDAWLTHDHATTVSFGAYTFAGCFSILGIHSRAMGLYQDITVLTSQVDTNIYTMFRGLIEDFTVGGAAFACLVFGLFAGVVYRKALSARSIWLLFLASFYALLIWSPLASLFVYNGPFLGWVLAVTVLKLSETRTPDSITHLTSSL